MMCVYILHIYYIHITYVYIYSIYIHVTYMLCVHIYITTTWMDLEGIKLSEVTLTEKDKYYTTSLIRESE